MRILKQPKVYLIGRPSLCEAGLQEFLADSKLAWPTSMIGVKDCEIITECAGRVCYMSFSGSAISKTNFDYIQNLLGRTKDGGFRPGPSHGSVVEHPCWTFLVVGAGRGFSHEAVRHRAGWSYSQLSTRYCDFERAEVNEGSWDPGFCVPPLAQLDPQTTAQFEKRLKESQAIYAEMVELIMDDLRRHDGMMNSLSKLPEREKIRMLRKAARGAARDLLVNATEAIMVMSANARSLWNCIYLRASEHAEAVIRDVFVQIARIMESEMPSLFHGLKYEKVWDGTDSVIMPRDHI